MKLSAVRSLWLVFVLTMVFSMTACGDYKIHLPGGYSLVSVYAGAVLIAGDHVRGVVINSNVDSYKVLNELVVGHVNTPDHLSPEEKDVSKPGYFILNTKTHEVKEGLDKKAWLDTLRALGVNNEPGLSKPSRFDKDYQ